jgi:hypothetical protein
MDVPLDGAGASSSESTLDKVRAAIDKGDTAVVRYLLPTLGVCTSCCCLILLPPIAVAMKAKVCSSSLSFRQGQEVMVNPWFLQYWKHS